MKTKEEIAKLKERLQFLENKHMELSRFVITLQDNVIYLLDEDIKKKK
jgi:hypothetical protein